jgi:hypothetical protein
MREVSLVNSSVINDVAAHGAHLRDIRNYALHPGGSDDDEREPAFTEAGCTALFMASRRYFVKLAEAWANAASPTAWLRRSPLEVVDGKGLQQSGHVHEGQEHVDARTPAARNAVSTRVPAEVARDLIAVLGPELTEGHARCRRARRRSAAGRPSITERSRGLVLPPLPTISKRVPSSKWVRKTVSRRFALSACEPWMRPSRRSRAAVFPNAT